MLEPMTLNDQFVLDQLAGIGLPPLAVPLAGVGAGPGLVDAAIEECLGPLLSHHGLKDLAYTTRPYRDDHQMLDRGLHIVGHVLRLAQAFPCLKRVIEVDWVAHSELDKQKRYRDHITHPVRVTAIGWWLLQRDGGDLLDRLAEHYAGGTADYLAGPGPDVAPHTWQEIVGYAWLAFGLLHDSAYPLEYHLRGRHRLKEGFSQTLDTFCHIFGAASGGTVDLAQLDDTWLTSQSFDLDGRLARLATGEVKHCHSLLGALHHVLAVPDGRHSLHGLVLQLAARAIVTHHDEEDDSILADPLAVLLFACDSLQAWRRPFLHRWEPEDDLGTRRIRPLVECTEIRMKPKDDRYIAQFMMNNDEDDRELLRDDPYLWQYEEFVKPNRRVQKLIKSSGRLPLITLGRKECVRPPSFLKFMGETTSP